ncbi:MAG: VOC family protein [Bryobacterales bacterium]|nr:VOC family protein [Bryobacterales bacterium]
MGDIQEPGAINWIDLTVPDAGLVRDFYQQVVGWQVTPVEMGGYQDYAMTAESGGKSVAGVCHSRGVNDGIPPVWLIYITVRNLDASTARVLELGGRVIRQPVNIGTNARYAVIQDPAGAVCALFEDTRPPDEP